MTKTELLELLAPLPADTQIVISQHREAYEPMIGVGYVTPDDVCYGKEPDELEMMKENGYTPADCQAVVWFDPG